MKKWIKISDLLFFQEGPGVRNHQYTTNGVKLLNVANLVNGRVDLSKSERYISHEEAYGKYKHFLVDEGDFIIASSGIKVDYFDKKMGFIKKEHLPLCMNTSTIRLRSLDSNKLNINYFMYYLKSQSFKIQLSKQITGSAQLNFGPSHLKKMQFPLVDMNEQNSIILSLSNIENQIILKEQQLQEYDLLIKSRFVEMFGEVEFNTKNHDLIKYRDVFELNAGGNPSKTKPVYWENGTISWIGSNLCQNSIIYENDGKYITEEGYKNSSARLFPIDTVLVALVGATIGKTALLKFETTTNQNVLGIRGIKEAGFNPYFVYYYTQGLYNKFLNIGDGGFSMASKKFISELDIAKVNIENQNDFAKFVQQVDKLKFAVQQSLNETQTLFDSLMQRYFG
jgi:type I restriction enzyme S subunit